MSTNSLLREIALLFQGEPAKSFQKTGITNDRNHLTPQGAEVFLQFLFDDKGTQDAFYKEIVKRLLAARKNRKSCDDPVDGDDD